MDFAVSNIACRSLPRFRVKVGVGSIGTTWPKDLQFIVTMRTGEDCEEAAQRWLSSERGKLHSCKAADKSETAVDHAAAEVSRSNEQHAESLFEAVDNTLARVERLSGRAASAPARFTPSERLRDHAAISQRRKEKKVVCEPDSASSLCERPQCVAARERYQQIESEKEEKVAELTRLQSELIGFARRMTQSNSADSQQCTAARAFQIALMEILDCEDDLSGRDGETQSEHSNARC